MGRHAVYARITPAHMSMRVRSNVIPCNVHAGIRFRGKTRCDGTYLTSGITVLFDGNTAHAARENDTIETLMPAKRKPCTAPIETFESSRPEA